MRIEEKKTGNILVVKILEQRLDASVAVDFREKMTGVINGGNTGIVLNLAQVTFMDSSGLGALVSCLKMLKGKKELALCSPQEAVMNLFKLTWMYKVFRIFATEEEAVAALSK